MCFTLAGEIAEAIASCDKGQPGLLERHPDVLFFLRCQAFIELIRRKEPLEAIAYAQKHLGRYRSDQDAARVGQLQNVVALLAYDEPHDSEAPLSHLMAPQQRESVADALNSAVLHEAGGSPQSGIERLLRQLVATHQAIREANLGYGQAFRLANE